ncbi:MAG: arginine--tRNA ligase, partial [bacterium]|nr:arginine--tRNA ligase [bacterium]
EGDLSTPCALVIAQQQQLNPREVAQAIKDQLAQQKCDYIQKVSLAGPGFININLSNAAWQQILKRALVVAPPKISKRSQRVVVDYSGPNIGKPFSVGHLRSTVIGDAVAKLQQAQGHYVIKVNHLGDWGTQFGKLIVAVDKWGEPRVINQNPTHELQQLYVKFHEEAKQDPTLDDVARDWFKRLEDGDPAAKQKWQQLVDWSLPEYERIYELLGVSFQDDNVPETGLKGESFYTKEMLADIMTELKAHGLVKKSEGAEVLMLKQHDLPETVLIRSDGASVYLLRDLAALKYRLQEWRANKVFYHIGIEQKLHLAQLFATAVELGWLKNDTEADQRLTAALHGHYRLPEGKMSSRQGRGVFLSDLIEQGVKLAAKLVAEKNASLPKTQATELAAAIAIGAIKYNDLSHNRESDIIFDWQRALNLEGNSAPYLMYTHARLQGLQRKAADLKLPELTAESAIPLLSQPAERELLSAIYQVHSAQIEASDRAMPHLLTEAVFVLAQKFNSFYGSNLIINNDDLKLTAARLLLCQAVATTIAQSLQLLGIAAPDEI